MVGKDHGCVSVAGLVGIWGVLIWGHHEEYCEEPSSVSLDNQGRRASQLSPAGRGLLGTKSAWFSSSDSQLFSFQYQLPLPPAAWPEVGIICVLHFSPSDGYMMALSRGFTLHFLMTNELEGLFMCLLGPFFEDAC